MVSAREDYNWVVGRNIIEGDAPRGDLDRIIINGKIMPVRDQEAGPLVPSAISPLRGEDITFLFEAIAHRRILAEIITTSYWTYFSRKLLASQPAQILDDIRSVCDSNSPRWTHGYFLPEDAEFPEQVVPEQTAYLRDLWYYFPDQFYQEALYRQYWAADTYFEHGKPLVKEPISKLFDEIRRLEWCYIRGAGGSYRNGEATRTGTIGDTPRSLDPPLSGTGNVAYKFQWHHRETEDEVKTDENYEVDDTMTSGLVRVYGNTYQGMAFARKIRLYMYFTATHYVTGASDQNVRGILINLGEFSEFQLIDGAYYVDAGAAIQSKISTILSLAEITKAKPTGVGDWFEKITITLSTAMLVAQINDHTVWWSRS